MRTQISYFSLVLLAISGLVLLGADRAPLASEGMTDAAQAFVASLSAEQRETTLLPFTEDNWERWHYIPKRNRTGLRYDQMTAEQVGLADALLSASLAEVGYAKSKDIMSLEPLVLENDIAAGQTFMQSLRNADFYHFLVFGEPSDTGVWGWRVEGHHLSLRFAMRDGQVVADAPMFMGAEPHHVLKGPRKGLRVLGDEEDKARALLNSLDAKQRKKAIIGDTAPADIFTRAKREIAFDSIETQGIRVSALNADQQLLLFALIEEYVDNVPVDLMRERMRRVEDSGDDIYFAWMGDTERGIGHPHYYRVHGKQFLIEYDNVQHDADHSHTVWREYDGDFGRDLLAEHYRRAH